MLTEAVAAYFRELRAGRGFTQETLATTVEVGKRTIERLERNEGDVSVESFERIIAVLGASPDEVNYLVTHPSATVDEAKELARTLLQRDPSLRWATPRVTSHYQDSVSTGIQMYVRTLRESQRIARKALADVMGVSIAAYADWEAGRGNDIPLPTLVRAITHLGGTLEDLDQIAMASDGHEALGRRLADERIAAAQVHRGAVNGPSLLRPDRTFERTVLRRIAAIEAILHFILSVLKRAMPLEAEDIERSATLWFQTATTDDEGSGAS